jgi:DNA phosphorothioation-associated putative methyltransferase
MGVELGKKVGSNWYVHASARESISEDIEEKIQFAEKMGCTQLGDEYNVVRYSKIKQTISLLLYDRFFEEPFPVLQASCLVNLITGRVAKREYGSSRNPPILHRKELLLSPSHPSIPEFAALTECLERSGLFVNSQRIGTKKVWEARLLDAGFGWVFEGSEIRDAQLTRNFNDQPQVVRHRTAISRTSLSAPLQCLERNGFLRGEHTIFDYGCGRGDDLRTLDELGIKATGWDPHFSPDSKQIDSDIVNLGYVINVIEDPAERVAAVQKAYDLTETLLVISSQLQHQRNLFHQPFRDGVITSRETFQKYYTHPELRQFIESCLGEEPISMAQGIFFIFKDKLAEQTFLEKRQRRPSRSTRPRVAIPRPTTDEKRAALFEEHHELFEALYEIWLELGRTPFDDEIPDLMEPIKQSIGTLKRALQLLVEEKGEAEVLKASEARMDDLLVYLALNLFQGRPRYRKQPLYLQRDIKLLFRSHSHALEQAQILLFSLNDPDVILNSCNSAASHGIGYMDEEHSLTLHISKVRELDAPLRLYVGCAGYLYGDIDQADLVKIHVNSGKLSVMRYDEFNDTPLPKLLERIKVKLRNQDTDYFDYGYDHELPYLYRKSRYMDPSFENYSEQVEFDRELEELGFIEEGRRAPRVSELNELLRQRELQISGFKLVPNGVPKSLNQKCGRYLTYRELIECGETQTKLGISNMPEQAETFSALYDLARKALDPVIDYFGMIRLTYGFSSSDLSKNIKRGIAPRIDQHCSHEVNSKGKLVCSRGGAAADFLVEDEDMYEVAVWLTENVAFDRLYYYGADRPIHVSIGPESARSIVFVRTDSSNRRIPVNMKIAKFLESRI